MTQHWKGLKASACSQLSQRDYTQRTFAERIGSTGVEAGELVAADRSKPDIAAAFIPGFEIFSRKVHPQRHRGFFSELARREEGVNGRIGLWPRQWATATMYAGTAKGFHIHPPFIPEGEEPEKWFRRLFIEEAGNYSLRPYDREQWDTMFFITGAVEMILVDERVGLERRVMRFMIEGDERRGPNNVGVIIPAGVAHAFRAEGSRDAIMVYGTSTTFEPSFEGRIAAGVETAALPEEWSQFIEPAPASAPRR